MTTSKERKRAEKYAPAEYRDIYCNTCCKVTKHKSSRSYLAQSDGKLRHEGWCLNCQTFNEKSAGQQRAGYQRAPLPWSEGAET